MATERDFDGSGLIDLISEIILDDEVVIWKDIAIRDAVKKALSELSIDLDDFDNEWTEEATRMCMELGSLYDASLVSIEDAETEDDEEDDEFDDDDEEDEPIK